LILYRLDRNDFNKYHVEKDLIERDIEQFLIERVTLNFNRDLKESSVFQKEVREPC